MSVPLCVLGRLTRRALNKEPSCLGVSPQPDPASDLASEVRVVHSGLQPCRKELAGDEAQPPGVVTSGQLQTQLLHL